MNPFTLDGQTVAITGASGGIGSAAARIAVTLGAKVILTDLSAPNELAVELSAEGASARANALDVSDRKAVQAWVHDCEPIDALIDCGNMPFRRLSLRTGNSPVTKCSAST